MEALRKLRRRKGWSQNDLAEASGVGQDTISGIESGRQEPRPSTLRSLAEALNVEVEDIFREPEVPKARSVPQSLDELRDFLETRLGSAWIALPENEWSNWWRGVSRKKAMKRYLEILAEDELIRNTWLNTKEDREAFARARLYALVFRRVLFVDYFAPQEEESEEEFRERSEEGRAVDAYYQSASERQRQKVHRMVEEEQRQLAGAQA
jgi:transcriptional regulator with XRE-family HTH domain